MPETIPRISTAKANGPVIGWHSVLPSMLRANEQGQGVLLTASNNNENLHRMLNEKTYDSWDNNGFDPTAPVEIKANYLNVNRQGSPYDYIGIAGHNLADCEIEIVHYGTPFGTLNQLGVIDKFIPFDNRPILFPLTGDMGLMDNRIEIRRSNLLKSPHKLSDASWEPFGTGLILQTQSSFAPLSVTPDFSPIGESRDGGADVHELRGGTSPNSGIFQFVHGEQLALPGGAVGRRKMYLSCYVKRKDDGNSDSSSKFGLYVSDESLFTYSATFNNIPTDRYVRCVLEIELPGAAEGGQVKGDHNVYIFTETPGSNWHIAAPKYERDLLSDYVSSSQDVVTFSTGLELADVPRIAFFRMGKLNTFDNMLDTHDFLGEQSFAQPVVSEGEHVLGALVKGVSRKFTIALESAGTASQDIMALRPEERTSIGTLPTTVLGPGSTFFDGSNGSFEFLQRNEYGFIHFWKKWASAYRPFFFNLNPTAFPHHSYLLRTVQDAKLRIEPVAHKFNRWNISFQVEGTQI